MFFYNFNFYFFYVYGKLYSNKQAKEILQNINPTFQNPEKLQETYGQALSNYQEWLEKWQNRDPKDIEENYKLANAINISFQAVELFGKAIEIDYPKLPEEINSIIYGNKNSIPEKKEEETIESPKKIASINQLPPVTQTTISHVLETLFDQNGLNNLAEFNFEELENNSYKGIILIQGKNVKFNSDVIARQDLLNLLAHRLQGERRREFEQKVRSGEIVIPPVKVIQLDNDLPNIYSQLNINLPKVLSQMQTGEYKMSGENDIATNIEEIMPYLTALMNTPKELKKVFMLDDNPALLKNMKKVVKAWSNLELTTDYDEADIALIDEDLSSDPNISYDNGTDFVRNTPKTEKSKIHASISGGETPKWTTPNRHFNSKDNMLNRQKAEEFVNFINSLIQTLEK